MHDIVWNRINYTHVITYYTCWHFNLIFITPVCACVKVIITIIITNKSMSKYLKCNTSRENSIPYPTQLSHSTCRHLFAQFTLMTCGSYILYIFNSIIDHSFHHIDMNCVIRHVPSSCVQISGLTYIHLTRTHYQVWSISCVFCIYI